MDEIDRPAAVDPDLDPPSSDPPEISLKTPPFSGVMKPARVKCFTEHCMRCEKYFYHRHIPALYNTPCQMCPCTYFYGWRSWQKKHGKFKKELKDKWKSSYGEKEITDHNMSRKLTVKLTENQMIWLWGLLSNGLDGFFEHNKWQRKHCDNIYKQIDKVLDIRNQARPATDSK